MNYPMHKKTQDYLEYMVINGGLNEFIDVVDHLFGDVGDYPKVLERFQLFVRALLKSNPLPPFSRVKPLLTKEQFDTVYGKLNDAPGLYGTDRVDLYERILGLKITYDIHEILFHGSKIHVMGISQPSADCLVLGHELEFSVLPANGYRDDEYRATCQRCGETIAWPG